MKPFDLLTAIAVPIIWGMGFVIAKAGLSHFSPILMMALRFSITAACLIYFFRPPLQLYRQIFWISLVSATLQYSLTFNGLNGIDASTAALLVQLEVPFGLVLAWLVFGERITLRQALGVFVAFAGAILIIGEPRLEGNLIYAFLVIAGAFTWAVGQIMIKKLGKVGGFHLLAGVALFAAPQMFLASWLFEDHQWQQVASASLAAWSSVVYLGLVMTALGYGLWYRLLGLYNVNQCMPFLLLVPMTSVCGGLLFLDEALTLKIAIGGGLAVLGVAMITVQRVARSRG